MSVNVTEIERGDILHIDGDPWQVSEVQSQTPSARGASMMVKARLRNLRTGQNLARSWRGGETVSTAEVDTLGVQYLYGQGDEYVFNAVEDLRTLEGTEFLMLREGRVHFQGSTHELQTTDDPYLREFLS